jgi:adenosylcobyric acid synthase
VGICGGYQMLGGRVADPLGVESSPSEAEGLGLLDIATVMTPVKQTHQAEGIPLSAAGETPLGGLKKVAGYEIHMGETILGPAARPLLRLTARSGDRVDLEDGAVSGDGRVWGTYLHGLFDDPSVGRALVDDLRRRRGLPPAPPASASTLEEELDRLADHLESHLDLGRLFHLTGLELLEAG